MDLLIRASVWLLVGVLILTVVSQTRYCAIKLRRRKRAHQLVAERERKLKEGKHGIWDVLADDELLRLGRKRAVRGFPLASNGRRTMSSVRARAYEGSARLTARFHESVGQIGVLVSGALLALGVTEWYTDSEKQTFWFYISWAALLLGAVSIAFVQDSAKLSGLADYYWRIASNAERTRPIPPPIEGELSQPKSTA